MQRGFPTQSGAHSVLWMPSITVTKVKTQQLKSYMIVTNHISQFPLVKISLPLYLYNHKNQQMVLVVVSIFI